MSILLEDVRIWNIYANWKINDKKVITNYGEIL